MTYCILDRQCVVFDRQSAIPGLSHGNPLCYGCRNRAQSDLNLLRYDYFDLSQLIPKKDARNESSIYRPKPESSPTIDMRVFTLRGDIAYLVSLTASVLRRHLGMPEHRSAPMREGFSLDRDAKWLIEHVDSLAELPGTEHYWSNREYALSTLSGPEIMVQLRRLHRHARTICGLDARTITVPGDCPECGTPSFRRRADDAEKIWCLHCRRTWSSADYGKIVLLQLPGARNPDE